MVDAKVVSYVPGYIGNGAKISPPSGDYRLQGICYLTVSYRGRAGAARKRLEPLSPTCYAEHSMLQGQ